MITRVIQKMRGLWTVNGAALPHGCRPRYDGTDYMRHYDHGDP